MIAFALDRLTVILRDDGFKHDFVEACREWEAAEDGRIDRVETRVHALQAFMETPDGANLLAGYKRAANLLKQAGQVSPSPRRGEGRGEGEPGAAERPLSDEEHPHPTVSLKGEGSTPHDIALLSALDAAEPAAAAAVAEERFTEAMTALASLRAPIDAFFEGVMVNDPDPDVRAFRLALLERFTSAVHGVADFSKIEG